MDEAGANVGGCRSSPSWNRLLTAQIVPQQQAKLLGKVIVHLTTPSTSTRAPTERGFREIRQTHLTRHNSKIVRSVLNSACGDGSRAASCTKAEVPLLGVIHGVGRFAMVAFAARGGCGAARPGTVPGRADRAAGGRGWRRRAGLSYQIASASRSTWSRLATVGSKMSSSTPSSSKAAARSRTASGVRGAPIATPSAHSPRNP